MLQNRYKQPRFYPFVDFFLAFESRLRRNDYGEVLRQYPKFSYLIKYLNLKL